MAGNGVIGFIMILVMVGVLGTVGLYINEKISDKAALTCTDLTNKTGCDTYYNASTNVVGTVETGWDFTEIVILAIAAGLILGAIFAIFGGGVKM